MPISSVVAVPTTADLAAVDGPITIPFDPPIGQKIRYRSEKSDQKDGKPRLSWEIFDISFAKAGDGYHLTVTPIDSGSDGEKSAMQIAFEKKIQELSKKPFVVEITGDGTIGGFRDEAKFWSEIDGAFAAAAAEATTENERKAMEAVAKMFKDMTPEARTSLLVKDLAPLVEFAAVDLEEAAEVLPFEFETASAFNTKIAMEGTISVEGADEEVAVFSMVSRISPDALKKITGELFSKLALEQAKKAEMQAAIAALKHMRQESRGKYVVSRSDGTLLEFVGSEEISVEADGKPQHQIVTKKLTRVNDR